MSLITSSEVNLLAFITPIDSGLILPEFIITAEKNYIIPVITESIYNDIVANPASYTTLLEDYIKPCLAFYTKYILYNQLLSETTSLPDVDNVARIDVLHEIFFIARTKQTALAAYLGLGYSPLYTKPDQNRISGFLVSKTITPVVDPT